MLTRLSGSGLGSIARFKPTAFQAVCFQRFSTRMKEWQSTGIAGARCAISNITWYGSPSTTKDSARRGRRACPQSDSADLSGTGSGYCSGIGLAGPPSRARVGARALGSVSVGAVRQGAVVPLVTGRVKTSNGTKTTRVLKSPRPPSLKAGSEPGALQTASAVSPMPIWAGSR